LSIKLTRVAHLLPFFCGQANFGASSNHGLNSDWVEDPRPELNQKTIFGNAKLVVGKVYGMKINAEETVMLAKKMVKPRSEISA
jgi:hypothetical protein